MLVSWKTRKILKEEKDSKMSNSDRSNKMKTKNWLDLATQKQLNSPISASIQGILSGGNSRGNGG